MWGTPERREEHDYLGFRVYWYIDKYYAIGPTSDMPVSAAKIEELRAKIWRYWYAIELEVKA